MKSIDFETEGPVSGFDGTSVREGIMRPWVDCRNIDASIVLDLLDSPYDSIKIPSSYHLFW